MSAKERRRVLRPAIGPKTVRTSDIRANRVRPRARRAERAVPTGALRSLPPRRVVLPGVNDTYVLVEPPPGGPLLIITSDAGGIDGREAIAWCASNGAFSTTFLGPEAHGRKSSSLELLAIDDALSYVLTEVSPTVHVLIEGDNQGALKAVADVVRGDDAPDWMTIETQRRVHKLRKRLGVRWVRGHTAYAPIALADTLVTGTSLTGRSFWSTPNPVAGSIDSMTLAWHAWAAQAPLIPRRRPLG